MCSRKTRPLLHAATSVWPRHSRNAERLRFRQGATDLLALQIRERASFDARFGEVDAFAEYLRAYANCRAAMAVDAPQGEPPS